MAGALWLSLLIEQPVKVRSAARFKLLAVAIWTTAMLVDGSHRELEAKWKNSALGTLVNEGPSVLSDRPSIDPRASDAVSLLDECDAGRSQSLVLVEPELTTEVLLRANRGNALPIATPPQDIVLPAAVRRVLEAVPKLRSGTVMLADARYLAAQPYSDPNASLSELAVWQVKRFFRLQTLAESSAEGFVVTRLERRLTS